MRSPWLVASLSVAAIACTLVAGCAAKPVTKGTLCSDFMKLSETERNDAVVRIASELGNPDVVTPLGRPNVEYVCAQAPSMTLGQVIDDSRMTTKPSTPATIEPVETTTPDEGTEEAETLLTDEWKLDSGYSYKAEIYGSAGTPEIDTANAPPGKAYVTVEYALELTLTNTTPKRNSSSSGVRVIAVPVWNSKSRLCEALESSEPEFVNAPPGSSASRLSVCTSANPGDGFVLGSQPLAIDSSVVVHQDWRVRASVAEDDADEIASELAQPSGWVMGHNWAAGTPKCLVGGYRITRATISLPRCGLG